MLTLGKGGLENLPGDKSSTEVVAERPVARAQELC